MNARRWLFAYLGTVVAITFIHVPAALAALLVAALLAAGPARWRLLRKAVLAVLAFNLAVSLGYAAVALWQGVFSAHYLLLMNLRVLLLVFLGFWFIDRVEVLAALRGWPLATLLATLALGQIRAFERILRDFRHAFESRNLARPRLAARTRHAAAQAQTLLDKSLAASAETALAMRSRGAFDD